MIAEIERQGARLFFLALHRHVAPDQAAVQTNVDAADGAVFEHDAALAEYNLAASVGRLIAPELNLPVKLYDMERHYKEVKDKWIGFRGGLSE